MNLWPRRFTPLLLALICCVSVSALAGERILIVGDSHIAGGLGQALHEGFQAALIPVSTYGLVGANPANLIPGVGKPLTMGATFRENGKPVKTIGNKPQNLPSLKERLESEKPTRVIFEFGDNLGDYKAYHNGADPDGSALLQNIQFQTKLVLDVLSQASPKPECTWITPSWGPETPRAPYWKSDKRLEQVIADLSDSIAGKCHVIISTRDLKLNQSDFPTTDGLHYTASAYKKWGEAILKNIQAPSKIKSKTQGKPCATCG